ncbi:ferritin-like domain-containing protein [Nocardia uniformis]|uniref:Ferritin-like domain-containing protein n=1 Tax=Nocardia uniformis TaxID=53432 RepID=A0A849CCX1_9NOCA|nr:ferritin-like domain-containing protein [Nocardia uniformis]NNH72919.1 ferritin-like domain-containing protein [Nocardia uniformis]
MTNADNQALTAALSAEYAAVYAYGVITAYANPERLKLVSEYAAAHRARRDATIDLLESRNAAAPAPEAAYQPPFVVNDPIPAAKLAVAVETDAANAWRSVVERADSPDIRLTGIEALTESALRLANWQAILGTDPVTVAFPGQP